MKTLWCRRSCALTILPPIPAFYGNPQAVAEIIDGTVGRILLRLGIDNDLYTQWKGMK